MEENQIVCALFCFDFFFITISHNSMLFVSLLIDDFYTLCCFSFFVHHNHNHMHKYMLRFRSGFMYASVCAFVSVKECACMRACNSGPLVYSDKLFGVLRQRLSNITQLSYYALSLHWHFRWIVLTNFTWQLMPSLLNSQATKLIPR